VPTLRAAFRTAMVTAAAVPLALAPFGAGVAGATGPTLTRASIVYVTDVDGDFMYGIYGASAATPNARTPILAETGTRDVLDAKVSPDGTKVAATIDRTESGLYSLDVVDVATGAITTIVPVTSSADFIEGFDWSKDGQTLVFGLIHVSSGGPLYGLYTRASDGSSSTNTAVNDGTGMICPNYSPDGTKIVAVSLGSSPAAGLYVIDPVPAGSAPAQIGTPAAGTNFLNPTWSPDGNSIAATVRTPGATPHSDIDLYSATGAANQTPTVLAAGGTHLVNEKPQYAADGSIWFDRWDASASATGNADLLRAQFGHSGWIVSNRTNTAAIDEDSPSAAVPIDPTAPVTPVTFGSFGFLSGTSVLVRWTPPAGLDDYSHVTLERTNPDTSVTEIDNAVGTSYVDTGLTLGATYRYNAIVYDGAGRPGPTTSTPHDVTVTKPAKIVSPSPTSTVQRGLPFRVTWGVAGQPTGTTYDVDYAVKSGPTWALGSAFHWFSGTTATTAAFIKGAAGQTYYFRATVHDTKGNATSTLWTPVNVPLDQKSGAFSSGWTTITNTRAYWLGSVAATSTNGSTFTISPTSKSVSIIGTKCASCGKFAVYVDGHYRATVSTAASSLKVRQILWTGVNRVIGKHTIKLVAVLGARQTLQIDGVADPR
jgi:hypothetical protein